MDIHLFETKLNLGPNTTAVAPSHYDTLSHLEPTTYEATGTIVLHCIKYARIQDFADSYFYDFC